MLRSAMPHLHVYREEYGDKWATVLPAGVFSDPSDVWRTFEEFLAHCNILAPVLEPELFT